MSRALPAGRRVDDLADHLVTDPGLHLVRGDPGGRPPRGDRPAPGPQQYPDAGAATGLGAASSSCSYGAVALARVLVRRGASFTAAMAFEIASTNPVIELGIILALLLSWQFTVAEFTGGPDRTRPGCHGTLVRALVRAVGEPAGESGRTLANGDLLRIDAVTRNGLLVRRALAPDPRTGQRCWTVPFLYIGYRDAELGNAVTDHTAQGRTVHTALAVITGTEDRQHAYVALTRGTDTNTAYVFTTSPKRAGPRPAPELARYDQITAERSGLPALATPPAPPSTALSVLSAVLNSDAQQRSATQIWNHALSDADHLAILHAIWAAETTPAREQHYRDLLMGALPPRHRADPGHQAKWL